MLTPTPEGSDRCALCDAGRPLAPLDLPGLPAYRICAACAEHLATQGRGAPAPFEPRLAASAAFAWRIPLEPDARSLLARVLAASPLPHPAPSSWTRQTMPGLLEQARARLGLDGAPGKRPPGDEVAYALALAVVAGEELGPWERLERLAPSGEPLAELLFALHAHHAGRVRLARLTDDGELGRPQWSEPEEAEAAGDLELRSRAHAAAAARLDPVLTRVLDAARQGYQYADALLLPPPQRAGDGGLGHQVALLLAALWLERGDGPTPKAARDEGSVDRAERLLKEREAGGAALDPRASLLLAAVQRLRGSKDGCDRALARGLKECAGQPQWAEVEARLQQGRYARALASGSWAAATDALRARRALRPDDRRGLLELGQLYYRRSMPAVAREVLEATVRAQPSDDDVRREADGWLAAARDEVGRYGAGDEDGRLLLGACLLRLGAPREALDLLEPHLDEERPGAAQTWHLAGLCEVALGRPERALERLGQAVARSDSNGLPRVRRDLVRVVLGELRDGLLALEARVAPLRAELEELDRAPRAAQAAGREAELEARASGRAALEQRLAREVLGDEAPADDGAFSASDAALPALARQLARHAAAVVGELDQVGGTFGERGGHQVTLTSTDLVGVLLACELADPEQRGQLSRAPVFSDFLNVAFGFSRLDRATGGGSMTNAFLALRNLAGRRLQEAVRLDRLVAEAPLPLDLLLRFLAIARATDATRRAAFGLVAAALFPRLARRGLIALA